METKLLQFIGTLNDFAGENWEDFLDFELTKGFSESNVDELAGMLAEYLTDKGVYR